MVVHTENDSQEVVLYDISYMPHVSKHPLAPETKKDLEERVLLFLLETRIGDRKVIFRELFTRTERTMIAKRLAALFLLSRKTPHYAISRILKMSPSSIARFESGIQKGAYAGILAWLMPKKTGQRLVALLADLAAIPFEARHKSLTQLVREAEEKYGT